uniref:Cyclin N-terminal domain-containing protein n=1 Tax=Lotharella globosa TaxID=91324 RepID=A0A7S4DXR9_9EUKA|mmetsp:Transcript_24917/g.48751  ORF Transcript_24917/g.48751 Transcript_24917/m.48751 type:complete len:371 (+) Transcript_24917:71-1183(+)
MKNCDTSTSANKKGRSCKMRRITSSEANRNSTARPMRSSGAARANGKLYARSIYGVKKILAHMKKLELTKICCGMAVDGGKENQSILNSFDDGMAKQEDSEDGSSNYLLDHQERQSSLERIVLNNLFAKEMKFKLGVNRQAAYVKYRRMLVEWMKDVCEEYSFMSVVYPLSVRILDEILGRGKVNKQKYQLVAVSCMLIAAKYRETDDKVPTIEELNECTDFTYSPKLIRNMETAILRNLNWRIGIPVAQDFTTYYVEKKLIEDGERLKDGRIFSSADTNVLCGHMKTFSGLAVSEYDLQEYRPSEVAAAVVCCSRRATGLQYEWNLHLQRLTGYTLKRLNKCQCHLYSVFLRRYPREAEAIQDSRKKSS